MSAFVYDAVVIGGGIVGAACAAEFAQSGFRVALIEANVIGGGATAAGMGHIVVMDDSEAQFALTRFSGELWRHLARRLPTEAEYQECGTLWIAANEEELEEVRRKHDFYLQRGVACEILDRQSLAEAEPQLRSGLHGALLVKFDSVVYSPCVARFLALGAEQAGGRIFLGRHVTNLGEEDVALDDGSRLHAGCVVVATGGDATRFAPELGLKPRKGHLVITDRYPGFVRHQLIELGYLKSAHALPADSVAFNVQPRSTGQVLIGSSRQYGATDPAVEPGILRAMLRRAAEYMPRLRELSAIRTWTGFRAATSDHLPFIGPSPSRKNIYFATGHEGLGITTSLGTARLLVDAILGRSSMIDPSPYLPQRIYAPRA